MMVHELNQIIHADCMNIMRDIPDKYFELAIVDPPYGSDKIFNGSADYANKYKLYDNIIPNEKYFSELFRVSKNQIIWGGNYFTLPGSRGWILWDKIRFVPNYSRYEIAFSSFDRNIEMFSYCNNGGFISKPIDARIHPTQKPVALYRWLLINYAKPGDKIIDTHSGSGSCAIACHIEKYDFLAIEKDKDYFEASVKRLDEVRAQGVLF